MRGHGGLQLFRGPDPPLRDEQELSLVPLVQGPHLCQGSLWLGHLEPSLFQMSRPHMIENLNFRPSISGWGRRRWPEPF